MANMLGRAVARLERNDAIQLQLLMYMFIAKIYSPLSKSYKRLQESFEVLCLGLDYGMLRRCHLTATAQDGCRRRSWCRRSGGQLGAGAREHTSRIGSPVTSRSDEHAWDWRGFPELDPFGSLHSCISTGWMIYAALRVMFLDQLTMLVDPLSTRWLGIHGNCLILGRFVAYPTMNSTRMVWMLSGYHLIWRFVQKYARQDNKLTLVPFLLQSDHDIEQFYGVMRYNMTGDYLQSPPSGTSTSTKITKAEDLQGQQSSGCKSNRDGAVLNLNRKHMSLPTENGIQADTREAGRHRVDDWHLRKRVTPQELLMRHLTCYKVYHGNRVHFMLRPNRTRQARKKLIGRVARTSIVGFVIIAILALTFATYIVLIILSDVRYVVNYPGCYPLLDRLHAEGRLSIYDFTLKQHHLVASLVDLVENSIVWIDSGVAIVFAPAFVYLLNYDILLYWSQLQQKLELLLEKTRLSNALQMAHVRQYQSAGHCWHGEMTVDEALEEEWHTNPCRRNPQAGGASWSNRAAMKKFQLELGDHIDQLQFEMADFFQQVRRADSLIGDILTGVILIWLSGCAFIAYEFLVHNQSIMPEVLQLLLCLGFIVVCSTSYFLLGLRRSCLRSYQTLCSLIAIDRTLKKRQLIKQLDFFTQLNGSTYRLFKLYPYKPTTFITIVGWSFSCFFVALTLFGGRSLMLL